DRSMSEAVDEVLRRTGQPRIDVLQLAPFDLERIKAGEPFRRMQELRNAGRVRFFCLGVDTLKDARCVVDNSLVHAIRIGASHRAEGWAEVFDATNDTDTGIIAAPSVAEGDMDIAQRVLTDTPITAFAWPVDLS